MTLKGDTELSQCVEDCTGVAEIFVKVEGKIFRRRRGGGVHLPSGWLLRSAAGVQPYSSANAVIDSRALKRDAIIAVEIPIPAITGLPKPTMGLISMILGSEETRFDDEREETEHTFGIGFHSFQVHSVKVQTRLIMLLRDIDDASHSLDEEVLAIGQEHLVDERMRLRKLLAHFSQRTRGPSGALDCRFCAFRQERGTPAGSRKRDE